MAVRGVAGCTAGYPLKPATRAASSADCTAAPRGPRRLRSERMRGGSMPGCADTDGDARKRPAALRRILERERGLRGAHVALLTEEFQREVEVLGGHPGHRAPERPESLDLRADGGAGRLVQADGDEARVTRSGSCSADGAGGSVHRVTRAPARGRRPTSRRKGAHRGGRGAGRPARPAPPSSGSRLGHRKPGDAVRSLRRARPPLRKRCPRLVRRAAGGPATPVTARPHSEPLSRRTPRAIASATWH